MSGRRGRAWRWMVRALSGRRLLAYVFLGQGVAYLGLYAGEPRRTTTYPVSYTHLTLPTSDLV